MRGLDPRIHPSSQESLRRRWIAGSSPAMTPVVVGYQNMTTFKEARAFLLKHRTDYDTAVKGFRWPDPVDFNWALDWFDAELARDADSSGRTALWIVDAGSNRESKLSFEAVSRRSHPYTNL